MVSVSFVFNPSGIRTTSTILSSLENSTLGGGSGIPINRPRYATVKYCLNVGADICFSGTVSTRSLEGGNGFSSDDPRTCPSVVFTLTPATLPSFERSETCAFELLEPFDDKKTVKATVPTATTKKRKNDEMRESAIIVILDNGDTNTFPDLSLERSVQESCNAGKVCPYLHARIENPLFPR